tara:strand:+ start:131 stop:439 length:309 start_codon:yes stop_codon:yes gene_type:complete
MRLYHGTTTAAAISIMEVGFDFSRAGSNWGTTYGKGIYFTPNYKTARFYAGENGIVISVDIIVKAHYLKRAVSASSKKRIRVPDGCNCIVSPDGDEYVVFRF